MSAIETNQAKVITRLEQDGWTLARHGAEHDIYHHPNRVGMSISVPRHRTLSSGVARKIAKAAGW